jgi:hypothetical protein
MKTEHTKGPWTIEEHGKGYALYSGRDGMHHGLNLMFISEWDQNFTANARLIAAAPKLLEIAENIASFALGNEELEELIPHTVKLAREVIKEATGSTHNTVNK